jgi:hypothetical protein
MKTGVTESKVCANCQFSFVLGGRRVCTLGVGESEFVNFKNDILHDAKALSKVEVRAGTTCEDHDWGLA